MITIWEKESFYATQDVLIAGSGLVGLWSAFYLKNKHPDLKVTILERGIIPTGASTRNAGFACFGSLSEVVSDGQMMGTEKMLELVEMRYKGLEKIQKHFRPKTIDFNLCGGYELYSKNDNITSDELEHNIEYINSLFRPLTGSKKTYRQSDENIGKFGFGDTKHLVKNNLEGYLHSGKLVQALLQKVQGSGVQIFNQTLVTGYDIQDNQVKVSTNHNILFTASKLLICTNAFAKDLLPEADIVPARGQVLVTTPISGLSFNGTFHSDEGFYYFRNLGTRVLLGGARNKALSEETITVLNTSDFIQSELEQYLDNIVIPGHRGEYNIEHRWAGIMAMGSEKMPIVKELSPNIYCAIRMSGMGVALAPVAGQKVAGLMT